MPENANKSDRIRRDRQRTNLLRDAEYRLIERLCERMPPWVTPDRLTATGFLGSVVVFGGLCLGNYFKGFLLLSVVGFAIQWFGDSLDGRLAYFRNIPRKWYGWTLDLNTDWVSACVIGLGFYFYLPEAHRIVAFIFVIAYGGSLIVALLRYKVTDNYTIDSFLIGPTEVRILLSLVLLVEMFRSDTLFQFGLIGSLLLVTFNLVESYRVLKQADQRDREEKARKGSNANFTDC